MGFPHGRLALAMVVFTGLTACTNAVAGESARSAGDRGGAEAVLGDFTTFDPCSLVDPAALAEFGEASVVDQGSFEQCDLVMSTVDGGLVTISVGRLGRLDDESDHVADLADRRWIGHGFTDESMCQRLLVFTDEVTLDVSVGGAESADKCAIAEAGVRMVADAGRADHHDLPADSLARKDPCAMLSELSDDTVRDLPALAEASRTDSVAGHLCSWSQVTDGAATTLTVSFTLDAEPSADTGGEDRDIAGRPTILNRYDGSGSVSCDLRTAYGPTDIASRPGIVELAELSTYSPSGGDRAAAVTVATEIWSAL